MTGIDGEPLTPKVKTRTAQKAMKMMSQALAMANFQNQGDARNQLEERALASAGMSSAMMKSKVMALADFEGEEENRITVPSFDDRPAPALRPLPIRDSWQVENRSTQYISRNWELCNAFAKFAKPQPLLYRGVRGIDFLFGHSQSKHLESLKAQENGEAVEETAGTAAAGAAMDRIARALDLLAKTPFFRDMEKQREGILKKLAKAAVFHFETPGQVLFREFDPPGSCYLLIEGSAGVFIKKSEPNTPRLDPKDPCPPNYTTLTGTVGTPGDSRAMSKASAADAAEEQQSMSKKMSLGGGRTRGSTQKLSPLKKRGNQAWEVRTEQIVDDNGRPVWLTIDGFSIFADNSDLGTKVVALEPGAIIGEVALLNDAPRKASIKCLEPCEFLIIRPKTFRKVLGEFMDLGRMMNVLSGIGMFKVMEKTNPGIIAGLAKQAQFTNEVKGQIIFREGDPGQNCFVVVTGQVGVYIRNKDRRYPTTPRSTGNTPSLSNWRRSGEEERDNKEREKLLRQGNQPRGPKTFRTNEGFSYFSQESSLGDRVALLPEGTIFGELALQNDAPRAATIKCEQDSEILVLRKQDYLECIDGLLGKSRWFEQNVLGVSKFVDATANLTVHPSTFFKEEMLQPGHTLLFEGLIAKPMICVVADGGSVEFVRFKRAESNPAYVLADRPQSAPTNDLPDLKSYGKLKPSQLYRTFSDGMLRGSATSFPPPNLPEEDEGTVLFDRLEAGGIFCSMAALPTPGVEPFTVVVSSLKPCKIFMLSGNTIDKLPLKLLNIIRKHMANANRQRLDKVTSPCTKDGISRKADVNFLEVSELLITPIGSPRKKDEEEFLTKEMQRLRGVDARSLYEAGHFADGRRRAFANFA